MRSGRPIASRSTLKPWRMAASPCATGIPCSRFACPSTSCRIFGRKDGVLRNGAFEEKKARRRWLPLFVCKRREKIYGAGKIRQAKQVENQPGAGKGLNFPKGRYAPNGGHTRKKYFGKKIVFLTLSFGSIRAAVSEILDGSGRREPLFNNGWRTAIPESRKGRFV